MSERRERFRSHRSTLTCEHVWLVARREWYVSTPFGDITIREGQDSAYDFDDQSVWMMYRCALCDGRLAVEVER